MRQFCDACGAQNRTVVAVLVDQNYETYMCAACIHELRTSPRGCDVEVLKED